MNSFETYHAEFIDAQYRRWQQDPQSVSADWQFFFKGFEAGMGTERGPVASAAPPAAGSGDQLRQAKVEALKYRYRDLGHLLACMDPLASCPTSHPLLDLEAFGLTIDDLTSSFYTRAFATQDRTATLQDIIKTLKETYCRAIGVEYMHLQDPEERRWLQARMEPNRNRPDIDAEGRLRILEKLNRSALFEQFLNRKYIGVTRFSLEGGDALIPLLDEVTRHAAASGLNEIILGMAHRGRLNVQTHILGKSYADIFSEFEHCYDPDALVGAGDVKYHNGYLADLHFEGAGALRMYLVNNPSHLEAVNPVAEGIVRARQDLAGDLERRQVLPLLIHGDAAFAGQGVVAETLNMSQLEGYRTGGTVHVIINNQIGYTTLPEDARSTRYSTDVAKMLMVPIFHVHGENPEALVHAGRLALDYRNRFGKDVVIDLVCYRRYGHNEGDEPYFTQPKMYTRIRERPPLNQVYAEDMAAQGAIAAEENERQQEEIKAELEEAYERIHTSECLFPEIRFFDNWAGYHGRFDHKTVPTGVFAETLIDLSRRMTTPPDGFNLNPKLKRQMDRRHAAVTQNKGIDWANAESLAFASLLTEGYPIRLSGQDCGRGTFSQRHSVWMDIQTGAHHTPLNHLAEGQAAYEVLNSLLAEYAVMGFEYGYSMIRPEALTIWEAQFGDFANNAQTVVDLFLAGGESKWQRLSGLTLLLPHGYEGQGPEHSSARLERFLQLCAQDNMQVCYPSTPAQYFHLLRRQVIQACRKPLVVMTPKSMLRNPLVVSTCDDLSAGGFEAVISDGDAGRSPRRVLFCSGKIYYELLQRSRAVVKLDAALVRLEQFHPFPEAALKKIIKRYAKAREWAWVQEEPENMGGWQFVRPRLEALVGRPLTYIGRDAAASPATGFPKIFRRQQDTIIDTAVGTEDADRTASSAAN
ncbi:MAG: 2-oxoglutarate dehydrogenase E1 component [Desulfobacterales bacterium]|nr:2-oxoglutarate dehydrogenase E1 component [Desulfobacterales bacterium]